MSAILGRSEREFVESWNKIYEEIQALNARKQQHQAEKLEIQAEKQQIQAERQQFQAERQKNQNAMEQLQQQICDIAKSRLDKYVVGLQGIQGNLLTIPRVEYRVELDGKIKALITEINKIKSVVKVDLETDKVKKILSIFDIKTQNLTNEFERAKSL
jgi:hypothetical protein